MYSIHIIKSLRNRFRWTGVLSGLVVALSITTLWTGSAVRGESAASQREAELIATLHGDSPAGDKAIACKYLAVYGSPAAVPELARLLPDEQLASWARIALEAIPGDEANAALRTASESLQGRLLVGVLNSIGVRRDPMAVALLTKRLTDADPHVAAAAAVALGHIGGNDAAQALRQALAAPNMPVRSAVAEGCILCAEQYLASDRAGLAVEIYDEVREAKVPHQRIREATRGAILARGDEGIPLLLETLSAEDKGMFQIALSTIREFPGKKVDAELASALEHIKPDRAALLIHAMADRQDSVDLAVMLKAASQGEPSVRLAAIAALGRIGNASCLTPLMEVAQDPSQELANAAKEAIAILPGDSVDQEIVSKLSQTQGKLYPLLLEIVGRRQIPALEILVKALEHSDATVRRAALISLGTTVPADRLAVLIQPVVGGRHSEDAEAARAALKAAAIRMPDRDACAAELAAALQSAPAAGKAILLEIVGAVGGTKALETVAAAARSSDPALQDLSSRLLGEWMTVDVAPVLLDLTKSAPGEKYQQRAMRGYIRVARQFVMSEADRVAMCQKALEAARQPAEQKLVLEILKRYASAPMLQLAIKAGQLPGLQSDAREVALAIAQKLGGNVEPLRAFLNGNIAKVKLEIIQAEYGAGDTKKDVTDILRQQLSDSPLVLLSSSGYNNAFGGDPAPGVKKELKVKYRLDGKAGEATFAEDALLVFTAPK